MIPVKTLEKSSSINIGKKPMVILPLIIWREIENKLENLEMVESLFFQKKVAKARAEKKVYTSAEIKKFLKI